MEFAANSFNLSIQLPTEMIIIDDYEPKTPPIKPRCRSPPPAPKKHKNKESNIIYQSIPYLNLLDDENTQHTTPIQYNKKQKSIATPRAPKKENKCDKKMANMLPQKLDYKDM